MYYAKHHTKKPDSSETANIQKYNKLVATDLDIKTLAEGLAQGATFRPALLKGNKKSDWLSQQIFALDFDDDIEFRENGTNKKIKEDTSINSEEQMKRDNCHIIADKRTTLEAEIERCEQYSIYPAFGYYSFSSTLKRPRFRLVFISDSTITDHNKRNQIIMILTKRLFINSDESVINEDRMFYGGNQLIKFNFENTFNADELIKKYQMPDSIQIKKSPIYRKQKSCISKVKYKENEHIKAIQSLNVRQLRELLNGRSTLSEEDKTVTDRKVTSLSVTPLSSEVQVNPFLEVHSQEELYKYIYKINLAKYLGIPQRGYTECILPDHQDNKPSAHIYLTNDKTPVYKCFGCNRSYTIISITEKIANCSRKEAIEFIKAVYDLKLYESDWTKQWKQELIDYANYLDSEELKITFPDLYKLIRTRKDHMKAILLYFSTLVNEDMKYNDKPFFFASYNKLMEVCGIKPNRRQVLSQSLVLFALLNMIVKMQLNDIPEKQLKKAKAIAAKFGHRKLTGFYSFNEYGVLQFQDSDQIAKELQANNITFKGLSREYILRTFGEQKANEVYPQFHYENSKGTSEKSDNATAELVHKLCDIINGQGYCFESDIKGSGKTEIQWKRSIQYILDHGKFEKVKLNKEIKERYHISCNGYPNIIINRQ